MKARWLTAALLLGLVLSGCGSKATPAKTSIPHTPTPEPTTTRLPPLSGSGGGRIVFVSTRDGNKEIYTMNADGTDQRRLTHNTAEDKKPVWSPDGAQIAFESNRHGIWGIYVMNADGSGARRLTTGGTNWTPDWSSDGTRIIFSLYSSGTGAEIWLMNPDGTEQRQLTRTGADTDIYDPDWSPDGTEIVYSAHSHPQSGPETWTVRLLDAGKALSSGGASASDLRSLAQVAGSMQRTPAWSPDGAQIVFSAALDGYSAIHTINPDGTGLRRLGQAEAGFDDFAPAWSPDGARMAFQSSRDGNWEIYVMNADGSAPRRLTNNPADDVEPDWCP